MFNFREFESGPDPFGRKFKVYFKWLQTGITLRHADTVDVKFVLQDEAGARVEKTIALTLPDLLLVSQETSRPMDDGWCARLAVMHLKHLIETGEDMEKSLVTVARADLKNYAVELGRIERAESHAA
jgi:hypothetical protein